MSNISLMAWSWELPEWPDYRFDPHELAASEQEFLKFGGVLHGVFRHLRPDDEGELAAEVLTSEAMTTSAIEGEALDRASVRSSLLGHLSGGSPPRSAGRRERNIAELAIDGYSTAMAPLRHETLFQWHATLMQGRPEIKEVGQYRTHAEAMQIVSGPIGRLRVHYVAPPSDRVPLEMDRFVDWFNAEGTKLAPLARAGLAHLYFETIHPFEDGNGRIGRVLAEKALAQSLGWPSLTMLSTEIESRQKEYYAQLESAQTSLDTSEWLRWFADVGLAGQRRTYAWVEFLLAKTKLMDRLRGQINERQERVLLRVFQEGPAGFQGGLSAGNHQTITGASPATAGRDLAELVGLGALRKTGTGKGTRYWAELG